MENKIQKLIFSKDCDDIKLGVLLMKGKKKKEVFKILKNLYLNVDGISRVELNCLFSTRGYYCSINKGCYILIYTQFLQVFTNKKLWKLNIISGDTEI